MEILLFCCLTIFASLFLFTRKDHQSKHRNSQIISGDLVFVKVVPPQPPARSYKDYRDKCFNNSCRR